jgi:hypothetical protein
MPQRDSMGEWCGTLYIMGDYPLTNLGPTEFDHLTNLC